jgi:alkaline phosphatase D
MFIKMNEDTANFVTAWLFTMTINRRQFIATSSRSAAALSMLSLGACQSKDARVASTKDPLPEETNNESSPQPSPLSEVGMDFPLCLPLPFAHGVASGDPLADRVIIWTRVTENTASAQEHEVVWRIASDPAMKQVLKSGMQKTNASRDWTVKVDVSSLQPATTYYYQFSVLGFDSIVGRTRTAPRTTVDSIRVAVVACSSYWSSHWSGYSHIADRNDLDLVLHCGDYIYDFVDEDEQVRARRNIADTQYVDYRDWLNLNECRRRYALFRSDPGLLRAHQQHPWMIVWDNHDIDPGFGNELPTAIDGSTSTCTLADTVRAFYEWTPTRPPLNDGSGRFLLVDESDYPSVPSKPLIYRQLRYGTLLDIFGVDTQVFLPGYQQAADASHLPERAPTLLGRQQYEWLTSELLRSQRQGVTWRLVNNQTWISPWRIPEVIPQIPLAVELPVRWGGYREERAQLFQYMRGNNPESLRVHNTVFASGDMHGNWAADLIEDNAILSNYQSGVPASNPRAGSTVTNQLAGVQRITSGNLPNLNLRAQSVGVEFAPSSMGRGGADELILNATQSPDPLSPVLGARAIETATLLGNKNVQFMEWVDHGYGLIDFSPTRAIFEFWWQDKTVQNSPDVLGFQMVTWAEDAPSQLPVPRFKNQIDAVTVHGMRVSPTQGSRVAAAAPIDRAALKPR